MFVVKSLFFLFIACAHNNIQWVDVRAAAANLLAALVIIVFVFLYSFSYHFGIMVHFVSRLICLIYSVRSHEMIFFSFSFFLDLSASLLNSFHLTEWPFEFFINFSKEILGIFLVSQTIYFGFGFFTQFIIPYLRFRFDFGSICS